MKKAALEISQEQDGQLLTLAGQHRDIIEKQELLKGVAQDIVNKISYSTAGVGGASLFALPTSVAGLNTATTNISKTYSTNQGIGAIVGDHNMESAAEAAESNDNLTPYQDGVHPATLDRISFSLHQNEEDFEL